MLSEKGGAQDIYEEITIRSVSYGSDDSTPDTPMAMIANHLFLLGTFLCLETWSFFHAIFRNPPF
ncbi:hypothetical protein CJF30_00010018 [Rutstroemia sp. NJR-2017a BBW]|nr:hypothetical protein CJF30_00010018 [Rutstroemia sp. NJR-2017a BBW]